MKADIRLSELKEMLKKCPPGPVPENREMEILNCLSNSWSLLGGDVIAKTTSYKLYRAYNLRWEPPFLSFEIERHGGMNFGSSRAEIHHWEININKAEALMSVFGYRQVNPRGPVLRTEPIAEEIAQAIFNRVDDERLRWVLPGKNEVRIRIGQIIPDNAAKQTIAGRRKRFRRDLTKKLEEAGWMCVKANHYKFNAEGGDRRTL